MRYLLTMMLCWPLAGIANFELETQRVTDTVYALVGEIGPRSAENHALNNTMGFIITDEGVILVGSGASPSGARLIEKAVSRLTSLPIRWVINIGVQDHHWLGNAYFAGKGAEIIALSRTVAGQKQEVSSHLQRLKQLMPDEVESIQPVYASSPVDSDSASLVLGRVDLRLEWTGGGHFPGDAFLWLPDERVVFAGDVVFHERMLGIQNETPVLALRDAFHHIAALNPVMIVPGHGHAGDLAQSRRDTGDYLDWLVSNVRQALEDWKDIGETVDSLEDAPAFKHLKFYEGWHRTNLNRTYLQLESTQ